jgi:hypothetical protein
MATEDGNSTDALRTLQLKEVQEQLRRRTFSIS